MLPLKTQDRNAAPTEEDIAQAREPLQLLLQMKESGEPVCLSLASDEDGVTVPLPPSIVPLLAQALKLMAAGTGVSLIPYQAELTTRQAAEVLNVSRTFFIGMLEEGKIPFHRVGRHRRILREDVLRYKDSVRRKRRAALDQLAAESQEYGIGYDE